MKLSPEQIDMAVLWWGRRIKVVLPIKCEPSQAAQAKQVEDAARAAGPITDEQVDAFAATLISVLQLYDGPSDLTLGTYWTMGICPHLAAAIVAANIPRERLQCGIAMTFHDGGVQVRDGIGSEPINWYVQPLTEELAFQILADVEGVADYESMGDSRGPKAIEFLKALVQELKAPRYAVGDAKHVELWDAIDELIGACGGNRTAKSVARMTGVVRVERALVALAGEPKPWSTAP